MKRIISSRRSSRSARRLMTGVACLAVLLLSREAQAQRFLVEDNLPTFVESLQERLKTDAELGQIALAGGEIVRWRFDSGKDLRFRATGGTLAQRVALSRTINTSLKADPEWRRWLESNGFVVLYDDLPVDADQLVAVPPEKKELVHVAELLQIVQDRIEVDPALGGVLLSDLAYMSREGVAGRAMALGGRVVTDDQRALLEELLVETMAANQYWRTARHSLVLSVEPLLLQPISAEWRQRYYVLGLEKFFEFDYVAADEAFKRALAEAPEDMILSYWRVVTHIALRQDHKAEMKLRYLLERNPWGESQSAIAREFWRVQGPLRWRLQAIERQVLLTKTP
jgi:hypothetical protein